MSLFTKEEEQNIFEYLKRVSTVPTVNMQLADSFSADPFNRLRTSDPGNRLDVEFIYDEQDEFFDEVVNNGAVTHNTVSRDLDITLSSAVNGSFSSIYSHPVPYTPGCGQLIECTGTINAGGLRGSMEVFLRSNVTGTITEQVIQQKDWITNNKTSGSKAINWAFSHIFVIDFQSLKVGRIRFGLNQGGNPNLVATIENDNIRNTGYWQLPSLPVMYRLYSDGTYCYHEIGYGDATNAVGFRYKTTASTSAALKAVCCTVKSEGGRALQDMPGLPRSISNGTTTKTAGTTEIPLIAIRPRTTFKSLTNYGIALPKAISVQTDNSILLRAYHNPTLTGASWANVSLNDSMMEYDVSATAFTNGHRIMDEYIGTAKNAAESTGTLLGKTVLWNRLVPANHSGILLLTAVRTSNTNASVLAGIKWDEIR